MLNIKTILNKITFGLKMRQRHCIEQEAYTETSYCMVRKGEKCK